MKELINQPSDPTHQSQSQFAVAVCIPTADRPQMVKALLNDLSEQSWVADLVVVVDASGTGETETVCREIGETFGHGHLRYERWELGLTGQRRRGIKMLQETTSFRYVCMLDDDVTLAPDFLEQCLRFLESEEGQAYGGVSGFEMLNHGKPFDRLQRVYNRLGIYDGELRPGRWLYCGQFLDLARIQPLTRVFPTEFLPGGLTVWRMEAIERHPPPANLIGFSGRGEDKHLSLRVGSEYRLGVLEEARIWHYNVPGGPRANRFLTAYHEMRNRAIMMRDCDATPKTTRYFAFLGFNALHLAVRLLLMVRSLEFKQVPSWLGSFCGLAYCVVFHPRPSQDSLARSRSRK